MASDGLLIVPQIYNWGGNGANDAWDWGQNAALEIWAVDPTNSALNGLVWDGPGLLARNLRMWRRLSSGPGWACGTQTTLS